VRDYIFSIDFHLTVFCAIALISSFIYVIAKVLEAKEKIKAIRSLSNGKKWKKVPVKIEEKGFFINYPYPNKYTREYGNLSELQKVKAGSFEYENYKMRQLKFDLEEASGGVTILYRGEDGKLRNKISVTNNPNDNYEYLMFMKDAVEAYVNKQNENLVVLKLPDEREINHEKIRLTLGVLKSSFVSLGASSLILFASLLY
jgi:hypothetical protein